MPLEEWPQFIGGSYYRTNQYADSERTINMYPEKSGVGENNRSQYRLLSTPGITQVADFEASFGYQGPIYDVITVSQVAGSGFPRTFCLVGDNMAFPNNLCLVEYRGTIPPVNLGPIVAAPPNNQVTPKLLSCGQDQLLIINGSRAGIGTNATHSGAVFNVSTGTFTPLVINFSPPGWLGGSDMDFLDGYAIVAQPGTQSFYISAVQDATAYDPLDIAVENDAPDTIVGLRVAHRDLFVFGKQRILVWNNTGAAAFPFTRNNSATIEVGCAGPATIQKLNNTLFWLGRDQRGGLQAWKLNGYIPQRISTPAIEAAWQNWLGGGVGSESNFFGLECWSYQEEGHSFYVVCFPQTSINPPPGFTFVYDDSEGIWHERVRSIAPGGVIIPSCHAFNPNFGHLVGARDSAKLYQQSRTITTENGTTIQRIRTTPHLYQGSMRNFYKRIVLDITPTVSNVSMQISNDGAQTFGPIITPSITNRGSGQRIAFNRLGSGLDRVYNVFLDSTQPFSISAAYIEAQGGSV